MKILLALALTLALASCGSSPEEETDEPEKKSPPEQKIVGRIASVSKVGQFVLIQKYGPGTLPANLIYQSRGPEGRSASLRPSGERVRDFFAADLLNGTVEKGDAVITYTPLPEETPKDEESPDPGKKIPDSTKPAPLKKEPKDNQVSKNISE